MDNSSTAGSKTALEKWGFPLQELYRLAFTFYKQNSGKAIHLSYEDNLKLIAFKQQAALGPFNTNHAPALGVLDVIGRDRQQHWQLLGDITREQAMEGFIDLLDTMCSAFRPYIEAVRQNRDETLKAELRRMEQEKEARQKREREQQELLEEGYKDEMQRRQLQDALNKQTYQQFKLYAEKQFPGNPEQQAVLIHQLQREHYHQYMQQLHLQNQSQTQNLNQNQQPQRTSDEDTEKMLQTEEDHSNSRCSTHHTNNNNNNNNNSGNNRPDSADLTNAMEGLHLNQFECQQQQQLQSQPESGEEQLAQPEQLGSDDYDDYVMIRPAKIWTRPDIELFKTEVSAGDGDGVITIGHGDTVTVRVPTNLNGKCIFWEFATDNYDIGFGIYFEWAKPVTSEVTVHVSDSDEDEDCVDEDYLSTTEDLESGSMSQERSTLAAQNAAAALKAPISIIVPIYRRECYNEVYVGSHSYPGEGVYLLKFDNSYSIWRSKTLYYRVYYER
ncbi:Golgi resident protein GCP60 [Drosophila grimshawi]|uniref:GH12255 n=1 Tax=Drosophila grimshawi TaxID=7222 RepID=B4JJH7_DROGR|nr:Golgi resident protein GCP60 [Drosophila grimshawi]EDV99729.1 GH12255 [Drosophila grimshawi]